MNPLTNKRGKIDWMITLLPLGLIIALCILFFFLRSLFLCRRSGHLLLELQRFCFRLKARLRRVNPFYLQFHPSLRSEAPPLSRRGPIFYLPSSNLACACVKPIAASCSPFGITPAESSALPLSASKLSLYFFAVIVVCP